MAYWYLFFLLACQPPIAPIHVCWDGSARGEGGCPEYPDTGQVEDGYPDTGQVEGADALLTPEEVQATLSDIVLSDMPDLVSLHSVFEQLFEEMDSDCPGQGGTTFAIDDACTTASGYTFYGVSSWRTIEKEVEGGHQYVHGSGNTSLEITDPDGHTFVAGGAALLESEWSDTELSWTVLLRGTFHYPLSDSWFRTRASSSIVMVGSDADAGQSLVVNGGFSMRDQSVYFSELKWNDGCAEPSGDIHLREPATGRWYQLSLVDDCSGCGVLSFTGEPIGEACLALGSLLQSTNASLDPR